MSPAINYYGKNSMQLALNKRWMAFTLCVFGFAIWLSLSHGTAKMLSEVAVLDVIGEGSIVLLTLGWIIAALASRPPGNVTTQLVVGLNCFMFTAMLDLLDEFEHYSEASTWLSMIESVPAGIGMLIMSYALYGWHLEQRALNQQLRRREWDYRSYQQIDDITHLYRADYWRARFADWQQLQQSGHVIVLDINDFSRFNRMYGQKEGDRFLKEVAQLLTMNIREQDLACRYAGDRFVLLMPGLTHNEAQEISRELQACIRHVAFRCNSQTTAIFTSARTVFSPVNEKTDITGLLRYLNRQLDDMHTDAA